MNQNNRVKPMKDSNQLLTIASITILIGIILISLSKTNLASTDNPFLTEQAFFTMGFLFFGFTLGLLVTISYIIKQENKTPQTSP